MSYTINQINSLKGLVEVSICRTLNVGLNAPLARYNPDDTRNTPTKILFEVKFKTTGDIIEISVEFDVANSLVTVNYLSGTITDIQLLSTVLTKMANNVIAFEKMIIEDFIKLIPPQV